MKSVKILSIITLAIAAGTLGFAIYKHVKSEKNVSEELSE